MVVLGVYDSVLIVIIIITTILSNRYKPLKMAVLLSVNKPKTLKFCGFTLIELIVVIAILGILAALAIPRLVGVQDTARTKSHDANIQTLKSAANIAIAENGSPAAKVTWTVDEDGDITTSPAAETKLKGDKYVDAWPTDPWERADTKYSVTIETEANGSVVEVTGVSKP